MTDYDNQVMRGHSKRLVKIEVWTTYEDGTRIKFYAEATDETQIIWTYSEDQSTGMVSATHLVADTTAQVTYPPGSMP